MLVLSFLFIYWQKVPNFLKIFWGYFLLRAVFMAYGPFIIPDYAKGIAPYYWWVSAQDAFQILLIPILVLQIDTKKLIKALQIICAVNLVFAILTYKTRGAWYTGNTMDLAICSFFFLSWGHRAGTILNLFAVIFLGGSTAKLMMVSQLLAKYKKYWFSTLPLVLLAFFITRKYAPTFFTPSDRFTIWQYSMSFWEANSSKLFGEGIGAYSQIGPVLGEANKVHTYMWMHNDWLQVMFDTGFIGIGLSLALFFASLWKTRREPILLGQVLSFGVMMMFYSPLRLIIGQALLCVLLKQIWSKTWHISDLKI